MRRSFQLKGASEIMRVNRIYICRDETGKSTCFAVLRNGEKNIIKAGGHMLESSSLCMAIQAHNNNKGAVKDGMNHKTRLIWLKVIYALLLELGIDPRERGAVSKALSLSAFDKIDGLQVISVSGFYNLMSEIKEINERGVEDGSVPLMTAK
jgi:hypothetical protein